MLYSEIRAKCKSLIIFIFVLSSFFFMVLNSSSEDVLTYNTRRSVEESRTINEAISLLLQSAPKNGTFLIEKWVSILSKRDSSDRAVLQLQEGRQKAIAPACKNHQALMSIPSIQPLSADLKLLTAKLRQQLPTSGDLDKTTGTDYCLTTEGKHTFFAPADLQQIFVNDDLGILYCAVPKVAHTQWKRIMIALSGKVEVNRLDDVSSYDLHNVFLPRAPRFLKKLSKYPPLARCHRLNTYFKFLFVRDPMERFLSAYLDKFIRTSKLWVEYTSIKRKIFKRYRGSGVSTPDSNDTVKFEEFVRYVVETGEENNAKNITHASFDFHWKPQYEICHPCDIKYNFIGKFETLEDDANFLLKMIWSGANYEVAFPKLNSTRVRTSELVDSSFSNVSNDILKRFWTLYRADYDLFGYKYPSRL